MKSRWPYQELVCSCQKDSFDSHRMIPHTKLFNGNSQIVKLANIIFVLKKKPNLISLIHNSVIFSGQQGVFHKFGKTVIDLPTLVSHPPSQGTCPRGATTLRIKGLVTTLSIDIQPNSTECHYAVCRDYFYVMLSVVRLNIIMLSVVAPPTQPCGWCTHTQKYKCKQEQKKNCPIVYKLYTILQSMVYDQAILYY